MTKDKNTQTKDGHAAIDSMFKAGFHFGVSRSRRHPTTKAYIFGVKNNTEIFDLEKTEKALEKALAFVKNIGANGKQILFVAGKSEAKDTLRSVAENIRQPFVAGRWIGGTLTNSKEIRKRVDKYETRNSEKAKGELAKYTKKERLIIDREIDNLEIMFGGIVSMKDKPAALVVIDPKKEAIAVEEARQTGVPVIALASSDCDLSLVTYPVPGNDTQKASIKYFLDAIAKAYSEALVSTPAVK